MWSSISRSSALLVLRADAFDAVEVLAAVPLHRQRMLFAEEDAAGVHLMAAQLGHQSAARLVVEPPVDEPLHRLETVVLDAAFECLADRSPGIALLPTVAIGKAVIAVPLGADELDVAQQSLADDVVGVVVQHAVVPLMPDGQQQLLCPWPCGSSACTA